MSKTTPTGNNTNTMLDSSVTASDKFYATHLVCKGCRDGIVIYRPKALRVANAIWVDHNYCWQCAADHWHRVRLRKHYKQHNLEDRRGQAKNQATRNTKGE